MSETKNKDDDADALAYVMKSTPTTPTRKSSRKNNNKANKVVPPSEATMSQTMAEDADVGDYGDGDENGGVTGDGGVTAGDECVDGKKDVDNNNDIINTDNSSPTNTTAATTSPTSKIQTVSNLCMYVIGAYLYNLTISYYALFSKLENDDIGTRTTCKYYYVCKW
jgi:hypothetical protein